MEHKGLNSEGDPDRQKHARINEHTRWQWTTPWRDTAWLCSPFLSRGGFSRVSMSISSILQLPCPPPNISHQRCPHISPSMRKMMITWQPCFCVWRNWCSRGWGGVSFAIRMLNSVMDESKVLFGLFVRIFEGVVRQRRFVACVFHHVVPRDQSLTNCCSPRLKTLVGGKKAKVKWNKFGWRKQEAFSMLELSILVNTYQILTDLWRKVQFSDPVLT